MSERALVASRAEVLALRARIRFRELIAGCIPGPNTATFTAEGNPFDD